MIKEVNKTQKINHSLMGKFQRKPKSNTARWKEVLKIYRVSKLTTELIDRFSLNGLAELTGSSPSYISGVEGFHIKPNQDFINKLERLNG